MTARVIPQPQHSKSKNKREGQSMTLLSSKKVDGKNHKTKGVISKRNNQMPSNFLFFRFILHRYKCEYWVKSPVRQGCLGKTLIYEYYQYPTPNGAFKPNTRIYNK